MSPLQVEGRHVGKWRGDVSPREVEGRRVPKWRGDVWGSGGETCPQVSPPRSRTRLPSTSLGNVEGRLSLP